VKIVLITSTIIFGLLETNSGAVHPGAASKLPPGGF